MNEKTILKNPETTEQPQQPEGKPYTFRKLETQDIFPMFKLLNKIGFKDLKDNEGLKKTMFLFMGGTAKGKVDVNSLGIDIFFEVAAVIAEAIPKAETEIYSLLASVACVEIDDIKKQPPAVTLEMILDFVKKEEFKDFFKVVLKLFK